MKYDAIFTDKPCSSTIRSRRRPETRPEIYSDQIHPGIGNIDPPKPFLRSHERAVTQRIQQ